MKGGSMKYRSKGTTKYNHGRSLPKKANVRYADKGASKISGRRKK
jgi:hypothetical protein